MSGTFIINPWLFYLFEVINNLRSFLTDVSFFTLIAIVFLAFAIFFLSNINDVEELKTAIKTFKLKFLIGLFVMSMCLPIFLPSKEVCYQMLVASCATEENLKLIGDTSKNAVDYIIEKIDTLIEDKDKE